MFFEAARTSTDDMDKGRAMHCGLQPTLC